MKYLCFALEIIFVIYFIPGFAACSDQSEADSRMYQWTDDSGTVSFTDNPIRIPKKYLKKAKKRDSMAGKTLSSQEQNKVSGEFSQMSPDRQLFGGHDEHWWRGQFSGLRLQIKTINEALPEKKARLKELHYKKVVSNSSSMSPTPITNPRKHREEYLDLYLEIKGDEEKLAELEKKLAELDFDASKAGVPFGWRK
jgi:hypothetical protein